MPISAVDTINLAFQHTKRQLVQPFRFWQWARLAFVGLLAGELGSGGNFNPGSFNPARQPGIHRPSWGQMIPKIDPSILVGLITVIIVTGLVFLLVMTYISSVMRFILFDSVLTRDCHIREGWNRRQDSGWKYFLWQLGFMLFTWGVAIILIGVPAAFAFSMGWFNPPRAHILQLVLGGIVVVGLFLIFMVGIAVVYVLTKDFVIPQMALEGISAIEGWRRLWPMIQAETGGYAVYILMKIALAIGAGIVIGIVTLILGLIVAIPAVGVIIAAVFAGKTAGLTWNVFTITAVVIAGCIFVAIILFVTSLISVPAIVFFPAYAMYFFAPRYRPLSLALYPTPPNSGVVVDAGPPPGPPPSTPAPEPAG